MKSLILLVALVTLGGCASAAQKYAEKVGCTESQATVIKEHSSPLHETYTVECKGNTYTCTETPIVDSCTKK
jgi:uncharacterized protein YceK